MVSFALTIGLYVILKLSSGSTASFTEGKLRIWP